MHKFRISGLRQSFISVVAMIIGAGLIWFGVFWFTYRVPASHQFSGQVVSVSQNSSSLIIKGINLPDDASKSFDPKNERQVTVVVDANTKILKTVLQRPSQEELIKNKGVWDLNKIKPQIVPGSLSELAQGQPVKVKTSDNIGNRSSFTALEVNFFLIGQ